MEYIDYEAYNSFWGYVRYTFESLTAFDAIVFVILLLATIAVAWKAPGKISSVGKVIITMCLICLFVDLLRTLNEFRAFAYLDPKGYQHALVDNASSIVSCVIVGAVTYIINNILYIIRTPRI
ncbi:MAG: hypothetical protein IKZ89_03020 [Bacteroidaceae bacterium]|nr:hypothetical protein [Bacteroidaceae bacterium]